MPDEGPAKPSKWQTFLERSKRGLHVALIVAALLIAARIAQLSLADAVVIEPVSVPKSLVDSGYSGEVVAARLSAEMNDVFNATGEAEIDTGTNLGQTSKLPALGLPDRDVLADIEVPETKLSVKTAVELTRYLAGVHPSKIKGILLQNEDGLRFVVEVRSERHHVNAAQAFQRKSNELDALLADAAHFAVEQLAPFAEARYRFLSGHEEEAREMARRAQHSRTCDDECKSLMCVLEGQYLSNHDDQQGAIAKYDDALALDEHNVQARTSAAYAFVRGHKLLAALARATDAVQHSPKSAEAFAALGDVQDARGQLKPAEAAYRRALELDPSLASCEAALGDIDYRTGRGEKEGDEHFLTAIALEPHGDIHHFKWALALAARGTGKSWPQGRYDYDRAADELIKAFKTKPERSTFYVLYISRFYYDNDKIPPEQQVSLQREYLTTTLAAIDDLLRTHANVADLHHAASTLAQLLQDPKREKEEALLATKLDPKNYPPEPAAQ